MAVAQKPPRGLQIVRLNPLLEREPDMIQSMQNIFCFSVLFIVLFLWAIFYIQKFTPLKTLLVLIFCFVAVVGAGVLEGLAIEFSDYSIEQIIFNMYVPMDQVDQNLVFDVLERAFSSPLALYYNLMLFCFLPVPLLLLRKNEDYCSVLASICSVYFFAQSLFSIYQVLDFEGFLQRSSSESTMIATYYSDPVTQNLQFPDDKRNLIFITLESVESTLFDANSGGQWEYNVLPHLSQLATENISFWSDEETAGLYSASYTSWTVASLVGASSGMPYKLPLDGNSYTQYSAFLPGLTSLGDILEQEGYQQNFFLGSDASYAGRDNYFTQHGNVEIFDLKAAIDSEVLPEDYFTFWGYEDQKLFQYAKEFLDSYQETTPFALYLLTVDTHFPNGYYCPLCRYDYSTGYENVFDCADRQIYDFVQWVQEQDFYENTTFVITSDHFSMNNDFFEERITNVEDRRLFHCIINPDPSLRLETNIRGASVLDLFPTTLATLGVTWDSDRLGIGTNLFSDTETLIELYGIEAFNEELKYPSTFFNENILYVR